MSPSLSFVELEFVLIPARELEWPVERRGIILRGTLGQVLRSVACDQICDGNENCKFAAECAYRQLFAPQAEGGSTRLGKNADRPRPFVLESDLDHRQSVPAGDPFVFSARLFGRTAALYPYLIVVFSQLFRVGLGRNRTPCRLQRVRAGERTVFADGMLRSTEGNWGSTVALGLDAEEVRPSRFDLKFLTPTYLKDKGREARDAQAAFPALVRRARDRISSLYQFYEREACGVDLPWDFRAIGEEAEQARCVTDQAEWHSQTRRSMRTGRIHNLEGLVGRATYENVSTRSLALVRLAELTHVGKHATFGLGRIEVVQ